MKIQTTVFLLLLTRAIPVFSQSSFYTLKVKSEAYHDLTNTSWHIDNPDKDYSINSLPGFKIFNKELGSKMTILKNGWVINTGPTNSFSIAPFLAYRGLEARTNLSVISAVATVEANNDTIIKIEWKNMGLIGNDTGDFVNFQLWISKKTQQIDFKYGPSRITDTIAFKGFTGPDISLMLFSPIYDSIYEIHKLKGDPLNPIDTTDATGLYSSLLGWPLNGSTYSFQFNPNATLKELNEMPTSFLIYPNPSSDHFQIYSTASIPVSVVVYDMLGNEKIHIDEYHSGDEIPIQNLSAGTYFIRINDDKPQKLIVVSKN